MIDIQLTGLVKEFEVGRKILDGFSLQVDTGERVGLLGRNGAGKTTIFRIITGEVEADEGTVTIATGKRVGLISQIPIYPEGYTVEDVLDTAFERLHNIERELAELKARPVEVAVESVCDPEAIARARAEAVAEMQAKLDKAKEAKAKADDKRKRAEASVEILKKSLEEREKAEKKAALGTDKEVAQFEVLFLQGQELANKMKGYLIKARGREDRTAALGMEKALKALAEAIGRCVE